MGEVAIIPTLQAMFREIDRRLRAIESASQLQNSSLTGGSITALNDSGQRVAEFGSLAGGDYGFAVNEAASLRTLFLVTDAEGWIAPVWQHSWRDANASVTVTSGSFTPVYRTVIPVPMSTVIVTQVITIQEAATTGELRLTIEGVTSTSVKTLPAATQTTADFAWQHGQDIGVGAPAMSMVVEARRTGGVGNVYVYWPNPLESSSGYVPAPGGLVP